MDEYPIHNMTTQAAKKPTIQEIIAAIKAVGETEAYKKKYSKFQQNGHPIK
jgi:hypothetical protein